MGRLIKEPAGLPLTGKWVNWDHDYSSSCSIGHTWVDGDHRLSVLRRFPLLHLENAGEFHLTQGFGFIALIGFKSDPIHR